MTFAKILDKYRKISTSEVDKGTRFEVLMKNFLKTYQIYSGKFSEVWMWNDFPYRAELGGKDLGIDIVAKTYNGEFWAVQCKCYAKTTQINKPAVDSFLATSSKTFDGDKKFSNRLWISTTNNWNNEAEITIKNQVPPVSRIGLTDLENAAVDWEKLDAGITGDDAVIKIRQKLKHQQDAINAAQVHFQNHERGKLIMACGTGKTYTSLKIAEKLFPRGKILFLVPSISLLSQTLAEWSIFAELPLDSICVCSDETASRGRTEDLTQNEDLPLPATTDKNEIARRLNLKNPRAGLQVVFSTYQSLKQVSEAQKIWNEEFDLIICDEAHRTTGYGKDATAFTAVHSNDFIKAKKRMYMTATPRLYTSKSVKKSVDKDLMLWSMDDKDIYGEEFFYIGFGDAIKKNLLSDYKVIVLNIGKQNIPAAVQNALSKNGKLDFADSAKIVGCLNAIFKKSISNAELIVPSDPAPMKKAVAFCTKIETSKNVANAFNELQKDGFKVAADYVEGKMSSAVRNEKLKWLKDTPDNSEICRILTNARCLSEGVDVPTLDAVIFFSPKKSKIDIVQAVGRVMRKPHGTEKKYGYVIIPVVIPVDKNPEDVLAESDDFGTIWDILNAMRAHDTRIDILIEDIKMNKKPTGGKGNGGDGGEPPEIILDGFSEEWQKIIYARMVENVGNRLYWEQWAQDISKIAETHKQKILQLTATREFRNFILDLRENINPTISEKDAVEMLAQHLISRPVFDALFENYSFAKNNAISKSMQQILDILDTGENDNAQLEKFYNSVRERCSIAKTAEDKQKIIIELYDKFFKIALPKEVEKLGIVYTPVEVVDFILNSVNDVLQKEFNRTLSSKNVHILDPFTGTGTFITRLLQSGLILKKDLLRKYQNELHANEIVLLAYYIAAINIENSFHDAAGLQDFFPFDGICLTDTFQTYENQNAEVETFQSMHTPLQENFERVKDQLNTEIKVIIGNPPYSVGQKSANDNAQNNYYAKLESHISETYAAGTQATNKNSLYDSYIKAFRWASDRINGGGIIAFVTNAGWLDGAAMDGLRKCFAREFSSIYVFNLRGNQRTQGEISRKEGGKIFGSGSRAPIAITILVKNPDATQATGNSKEAKGENPYCLMPNASCLIKYCDIGDYLSRDEKLRKITRLHSVLSDEFKILTPNDKGDWINQRGDSFENYLPLAPAKKFDATAQSFFVTNSRGIATARDVWCYNFSKSKLEENMQTTINFYNENTPLNVDSTKITWTDLTRSNKTRKRQYFFDAAKIFESMYRPFCKQYFYFDEWLNERVYQMPKIFPTGKEKNLLICVPGVGDSKNFSVFIVDKIPDLGIEGASQCFPLYWYATSNGAQLPGFETYDRRDGVTDFIWRQARLSYGDAVTKEDIFYYIYGFLHLPAYREKFSAELKKSLPRLFLVPETKKFWQLSKAGRALAEIHLNYETQSPVAQVEVVKRAENYRVEKLKLSADKKTLIYNKDITIKNIPSDAFKWVVNGRSPLEWIVDRYQVKIDATSQITNNPNDWATAHGETYILDLILSCITVSLKTLEIVENLPTVDFEGV